MAWRESATTLEHAIPLGTTLKARLVPDDGSPALSIRLHRFRGTDGDLEPVRTAIAHHVAHRLRKYLERGDDIPWTSRATFTREGVAIQGGLLGKDALLRYDEPIGVFVSPGTLTFYRETFRKPLAQLTVGDANFYPGLALFELMMQQVVVGAEKTA